MEIAEILEAAWAHAYPGREAAERNALLRALSQLQQQPRGAGAMLYRRRECLHPTGCVGGDGAQQLGELASGIRRELAVSPIGIARQILEDAGGIAIVAFLKDE